MMAFSNSPRDYVVFVVRMSLAAIFIYAGVDKIRDPLWLAAAVDARPKTGTGFAGCPRPFDFVRVAHFAQDGSKR
jgi:uncharacterized membrane protein YphA (DoxX/SURF4 family)